MSSRIDILTTKESERWSHVLGRVAHYDFYHLPAYHHLAEVNEEGKAILFVYCADSELIAFPMLLRDVPVFDRRSTYVGLKDTTSVYGYGGPVASEGVTLHDVGCFTAALDDFLKTQSVIAAYSRLHPLWDQHRLLTSYGEIEAVGHTVSIDLTQDPEAQWSHYRKGCRYEIRRLRQLGFHCEKAGLESLDDFIRIYQKAMTELNADPYYFFNKEYFNHLLSCLPGTVHLFVCRDGDKPACVGLFSLCQAIVQYHLSATTPEYRKLAPNKLMLDAVREWANTQGAKNFHLGGGLGGKKDALYAFKAGFTDRQHIYSVWKHIVDQDTYEAVCLEATRQRVIEPDQSYFPLYRHPRLTGE